MSSRPIQAIFSDAERAFAAGRFAEAKAGLVELERVGFRHAAVHHLRGIVEHRLGEYALADRHFQEAIRLQPNQPQIHNNHGNLLRDLGRGEDALSAYERALALDPNFADATLNRALLLEAMGRIEEARAGFRAMTQLRPNDSRGWTGAGALELAAGDLAAAASAYERALAIAPTNPIAANGVARVAMQRGEADALARYEDALRLSPGDRNLIRDMTELRCARGEPDALEPLAEAVRAAPEWLSGQLALARLRWERGDKEHFRDEIEARLSANPADTQLWYNYVDFLEACGLDAEAADTARRARKAGGDRNRLMLSEAIHAGRAGDLARAGSLFAALPAALPGRAIHESIHWIRQGEFDRALLLAEAALRDDPWSISYWGVLELLYRKTGNPRAEWLSGQQGLVATFALPLAPDRFEAVDALCLRLHRESVECIGQSVRAGTQTRWNLFDRREPELAELRRALDGLVAEYLAALPQRDETHPLLRHRGRPLKITTSWSIRLTGAGYHVSHFHPKGLVSSACYLRVPESNEETREGWLELGLPPDDFAMPLDPLISVQPEPGRLALFPSYLLHGTRRFSAGERMSVAFDVAAA